METGAGGGDNRGRREKNEEDEENCKLSSFGVCISAKTLGKEFSSLSRRNCEDHLQDLNLDGRVHSRGSKNGEVKNTIIYLLVARAFSAELSDRYLPMNDTAPNNPSAAHLAS
jgi:hypothetical protein